MNFPEISKFFGVFLYTPRGLKNTLVWKRELGEV